MNGVGGVRGGALHYRVETRSGKTLLGEIASFSDCQLSG
ncbi:hypothetical protein BamMEX5DRAFT_6771 [Burkholderia ambifaria MEX-5]|uniref:Uncharacterized protein n=1 Tax=Burkholderia ambifaria MEX-5 TaxID=396597 RepID=B1TG55_9BURK|nr:hypothetical protein BamMEX5DRAFT_6771 [Burkholderia ambifaria MEX-5]